MFDKRAARMTALAAVDLVAAIVTLLILRYLVGANIIVALIGMVIVIAVVGAAVTRWLWTRAG